MGSRFSAVLTKIPCLRGERDQNREEQDEGDARGEADKATELTELPAAAVSSAPPAYKDVFPWEKPRWMKEEKEVDGLDGDFFDYDATKHHVGKTDRPGIQIVIQRPPAEQAYVGRFPKSIVLSLGVDHPKIPTQNLSEPDIVIGKGVRVYPYGFLSPHRFYWFVTSMYPEYRRLWNQRREDAGRMPWREVRLGAPAQVRLRHPPSTRNFLYRAEIVGLMPDQNVHAQLVDWGECHLIHIDEIQHPCPAWGAVGRTTLVGHLSDIVPARGAKTWSPEACAGFREILYKSMGEEEMPMHLIPLRKLAQNDYSVELFHREEQFKSVSALLVERGFAAWAQGRQGAWMTAAHPPPLFDYRLY